MTSNIPFGDEPRELSQDEIKFDIYLRTREIKELGDLLRDILILPKGQRNDWLHENGEIMSHSIDSFIDDSNFALKGIALDDEMIQLSGDLVNSLRDTLNIMQTVLKDHQKTVD